MPRWCSFGVSQSRRGRARPGARAPEPRAYTNLFLTMLMGGLWHGAAGTYFVWGGLHGLSLVLERLLVGDRRRTEASSPAVRALVMLGTFVVWSLKIGRASCRDVV